MAELRKMGLAGGLLRWLLGDMCGTSKMYQVPLSVFLSPARLPPVAEQEAKLPGQRCSQLLLPCANYDWYPSNLHASVWKPLIACLSPR